MLYRKSEQDKYSNQIDRIAEMAGEAAVRAYDKMRKTDPNASVADIRESCIYIIEQVLEVYGSMAAETAAQLYDAMAEASGARVAPAVIPEVDEETYKIIEKQIRYDVGVFVEDESNG